MASRKVLPIDGALTFVVVVVFLVPSVLAAFKDVFNTRCLNSKEKKAVCDKAWTLFEKGHEKKDPNQVTAKDYERLFTEVPFTHPCRKTLLYSNTKEVINKLVVKKELVYTHIWDTMLGHVVDGDTWCGKKNVAGTFTGPDCNGNEVPYNSYFQMASIKFAQHACGTVTVLLNGEVQDPYDPDSYFAKYEVPNLQPTEVKKKDYLEMKLNVILAVETKGKQCNNESLKNLQNELKKGIKYDCKEVLISELGRYKPE